MDCINNSSNPNNREKFKPRKGDVVRYLPTGETSTVSRVEGDICHTILSNGEPSSFIWSFREGLNTKHVWGTK